MGCFYFHILYEMNITRHYIVKYGVWATLDGSLYASRLGDTPLKLSIASYNRYPTVVIRKKLYNVHAVMGRLLHNSYLLDTRGYHVAHINDNRTDFRLCNLAVVTHKENMASRAERCRRIGGTAVIIENQIHYEIFVMTHRIGRPYQKLLDQLAAGLSLSARIRLHTAYTQTCRQRWRRR